ncbi:MAG: phosphoribosylamine--glycine ligase [Victivallales bacterium]|nr:phosphoribosylamine--glycine ligase [Victivallales bacterium]
MNVLIIGGGGREHAIVWKIAQSPLAGKIYCSPGNPGMKNVEAVPLTDLNELADFALAHDIGLTMVGPEATLCAGIADVFRAKGLRIVGPDKVAAQLEGSKSFAKEFMRRHGLPTAEAAVFTDEAGAMAYLKQKGAPIVVKADGLAAGKGVVVAMTEQEAADAIHACFDGAFGAAGASVLLEECLFGEEASIIALCDGKTITPLASSQDHKRAYDGDTGPNTGGMGAYSPAPVVTPDLWKTIDAQILTPFLKGVQVDKLDFRGIIYAGLMITDKGPKVLEFNVRFGDPETQAILTRLKSDLLEALVAVADGRLADVKLEWYDEPSVCVVLASNGYPGHYEKGKPISGLDEAEKTGAVVFHAGTKLANGQIVTNGGRVLGVTARGKDIASAVQNAYKAVACISWEGMQYRKDIAHRALERG